MHHYYLMDKTKRVAYQKEYREQYGDKMYEQIEEWLNQHPDYLKRWRNKHTSYFKDWLELHPGYAKRWRQEHKQTLNLYMKNYMRMYRSQAKLC
jgi:hypothetical protein